MSSLCPDLVNLTWFGACSAAGVAAVTTCCAYYLLMQRQPPSAAAAGRGATPLTDVHLGLPMPPTPNCEVVSRPYAYHHYGGPPDHFDDRGWGCAYRSAQTLISSLLGVEAGVPTVTALQQALVAMGDKPSRFVRSQDWIGSTEVGLLVERLSGHDYRILILAAGQSMATQVPTFAEHFRTVGAPIMAGGMGTSAAATILGVGWGDGIQPWFLVLDPHYTGPHELGDIQAPAHQACQWQPLRYWRRGVGRYFCLPSETKAEMVQRTHACSTAS